MSHRQQSLKTLSAAYISAFAIVVVLATLSQAVIQLALNQEIESRAVSALTTERIIESQRLQRNTVLLIGIEDRTEVDKELASDLTAIQANVTTYKKDYPDYVALIHPYLTPDAGVQYKNVIDSATKLVQLEQQYKNAPYKVRLQAEGPYISSVFYSEVKELTYQQTVQNVIDTTSNQFILRIRLIEIILYGLNILVWAFELAFVLIPTTKRLARDLRDEEEGEEEVQPAPSGTSLI